MATIRDLFKTNRKFRRAVLDAMKRTARPDMLAARAELKAAIAAHAQGGRVAVVTWGRDCDGYAWENCTRLLPAHVMAVATWRAGFYHDAEGPQGWQLATPREAARLRRTTRDLALEAFEDGRPYALRS